MKLSFTFFLLAIGVFAQESRINANLRKQIEEYNTSFASSFINGKTEDLIKSYTDQSILMPEHSRQRIGKNDIVDFYKQWKTQAVISSYQKAIVDLQDFGNYILEIGTFSEDLNVKEQKAYKYSGKYMVLWKKSSMTIASEIWGSNAYFEDKLIPQIDDSTVSPTQEDTASDKLTLEVKERNNKIKELVQKRLGEEHAKMFLPDAMYLTYYTPILSGEKEITPYFTEHEKPGTLVIGQISIKTSGIIFAQKAIIEFGFYSVDWKDGDSKGNVKGKSVNVWQKNDNGELLLFRQMVNHD